MLMEPLSFIFFFFFSLILNFWLWIWKWDYFFIIILVWNVGGKRMIAFIFIRREVNIRNLSVLHRLSQNMSSWIRFFHVLSTAIRTRYIAHLFHYFYSQLPPGMAGRVIDTHGRPPPVDAHNTLLVYNKQDLLWTEGEGNEENLDALSDKWIILKENKKRKGTPQRIEKVFSSIELKSTSSKWEEEERRVNPCTTAGHRNNTDMQGASPPR